MSPSERILLALDAHECWGRPRAPSTHVDPIVVARGNADFGTTILGQQSISDLQDSLTSWDYRVKQMTSALKAFTPTWSAADPGGFADWSADYTAMMARYTAAVSQANSAVSAAKFSFTPNANISAQAEYDALAKAMRQCYPPDGCPTSKGDFDDLNNRLTAATAQYGGAAPSYTNMPQPKATDVDMAVYKATAPVDLVAQATGLEAPKVPGMGGAAKFIAWATTHKKAILVTGSLVAGGLVFLQLKPLLLAAKGAAALAA